MSELKCETIWFDQRKYEEAESRFYQNHSCQNTSSSTASSCGEDGSGPIMVVSEVPQRSNIVDQIAKARETIQQTLKGESGLTSESSDGNVVTRLGSLENENQQLKEIIKNIQSSLNKLEARVAGIEICKEDETSAPKPEVHVPSQPTSSKPENEDDDDDEDDDDLFGSDDDDEEAEKLKEIKIAQYAAKKSKKPAVTAKSNIILDVKPWDDETDMAVVESNVRSISCDGLLWGGSKLVAVGYGIKKLQINCVVEDDKVGTDYLEEKITAFEDHVQSIDIVSFNKV